MDTTKMVGTKSASNGEQDEPSLELSDKYRPKLFKEMIGQSEAVKVLAELVKSQRFPHALLLTGGSGTGKTTAARVLKDKLNCSDLDYVEINAAKSRGIDTIREIAANVGLRPRAGGDCRIWLIDEVHRLTPDAQASMLCKPMLEDAPRHAYFFLATTDPQKLLKTIITRCTEVKFAPLAPHHLTELLGKVIVAESLHVPEEVVERIVEVAEGSARKALKVLHQVCGLKSAEEMLETIYNSAGKSLALDLFKALLDTRSKWPEVAKIIMQLDEEPETVRHYILAAATSQLLGCGKSAGRAALIINSFRDSYFETKRAGLVLSCFDVICAGER